MPTASSGSQRVRQFWRALDRRAVDGLVGGLLLLELVANAATKPLEPGQHPSSGFTYLLAIALTAPLLVHRRRPRFAVAVTCLAMALYALGMYPAYPGLPLFALVYAVGVHAERRDAMIAMVAALVTMTTAIALQPGPVVTSSTWVSTLLAVVVAWLGGENTRSRRARWAALEERATASDAAREEQARRAVAQERLRIARELHDVVAHSMSVIAVQSGVGHHVIDSRPDEARRALATIETTSRTALVDMRRLLGVLRQGDEPAASLTPAPRLAELPSLISGVQEAGLAVRAEVDRDALDLPSAVDLTAYRIVQEGLTNVLRHGGPTATVNVRRTPTAVTIEILDDGKPPGALLQAHLAHPASSQAVTGHGLIGMRERVSVFGGEFSAAARERPLRGFRVFAVLPCPPGAGAAAATPEGASR